MIKEIITKSEKTRYNIIGSSTATICKMYISSNNNIIINDSNTIIYRTVLPDMMNYPVHDPVCYISDNNYISLGDNDELKVTGDRDLIKLNDMIFMDEWNK